MEEQAQEKKQRRARTRRPAQAPLQFPVEALVWMPGAKTPRVIQAVWVRQEAAAVVLGVPDLERPYMQKTIRISDASGAVVEVSQLQMPQAPPQPAPSPWGAQWNGTPRVPMGAPPEPPQSAGGSGAVLRTENFGMPPMPGKLRAMQAPGGGVVSEVTDEAGQRVVVPGGFGMVVAPGG